MTPTSENEENPGLLKLDLFCRGARLDSSIDPENDSRGIRRTRAGLGSGIDVILPRGLWVNIPLQEKFCSDSPYLLAKQGSAFLLTRDGQTICQLKLPRKPAFYNRQTSNGIEMTRVGVMQGSYLGIFPTRLCDHWSCAPRRNCQFCSVGLNLGTNEETEKSVDDVVETVRAAQKDEKITFVHFNTGHYAGDTYLDELEPYIEAVKRRTGLLIGVQTPPHPDLSRYDRLRRLGVNNLSFCFELYNPDELRRYCPGKAEEVGLKRYLDAIEYCAGRFDTVNGEIIAGLEPVENTLRAIDWMTSVGAIPTVCVFRPLIGTDLEDHPPPEMQELVPVFARVYRKCIEHQLPIGIAPNVEVAMIIKPIESRFFVPLSERSLYAEAKLRLKKKVFAALFAAKTMFYHSRNAIGN